MTDIYQDPDHKIFHGDIIEVLKKNIDDKSIDLIFADPPYNIGKQFGDFHDKWISEADYVDWCKTWLDLCIQKLKPNGSMYIMTSTQAMPYFDIFLREKINVLSRIIWSYDSSGVQAKKFYGSSYEPIIFCVKDLNHYTFNSDDIMVEAKTGAKRGLIDYRKNPPALYNTTKVPSNVWNFSRVRYRMAEYENHPTQKPEALLERIIKASSCKNDIILDPFSGSFTTSAVAKKLGRKSIGIEQNMDYVHIGLRRVLDMSAIDGIDLNPVYKNTKLKNINGIKNSIQTVTSEDLFNVVF